MSPYCRKQCCGCCAEYMYGLRLCTDWQEDEEDGAAESELEDEMEDEASLWHGLGAVSSQQVAWWVCRVEPMLSITLLVPPVTAPIDVLRPFMV